MTQRYPNVHMVLDGYDRVYAISTSDTLADELEQKNRGAPALTVYRDVSPLVVLQYLEGEAPWRRLTDDQAWEHLSKAMPEFQKHMLAYLDHYNEPLYREIPIDFPPALVKGRSEVLETHPCIADLSAMRELTEIHMAFQNKREVNPEHFRPASLKASWGLFEHVSREELANLQATVASKRAEIPANEQRLLDKLDQEQRELEFLIADLDSHQGPATSKEVHAIYDNSGELLRITLNDTEAGMASAEGRQVLTNVTVSEVLDDIIGQGYAGNVMDDATWQYIRSEVSDGKRQEEALFSVNPPDLPFVLAQHRFDITQRYLNVDNLQSYAELTEILMANNARRKVSTDLFNEESANATFREAYDQSYQETWKAHDRAYEYAGELSSQNASERAAFGDSAPGSAIQEALADYHVQELTYILNTWEGDDKPVEQPWVDIPY